MKPAALVPPVIILVLGAALWGFGAVYGDRFGAGWTDLLEGLAGFVMLGGGVWLITRLLRLVNKQS
jgi:hypothetical protein